MVTFNIVVKKITIQIINIKLVNNINKVYIMKSKTPYFLMMPFFISTSVLANANAPSPVNSTNISVHHVSGTILAIQKPKKVVNPFEICSDARSLAGAVTNFEKQTLANRNELCNLSNDLFASQVVQDEAINSQGVRLGDVAGIAGDNTSKISDIQKKDTVQDDEIGKVKTTSDGNKKKVAKVTKDVTDLTKTVGDNTSKISDIQKKDTVQDDEISKLKTTSGGNTNKITAIQQKNSDQDNEIGKVKTTSDGNTTKITQVKNNVTDLTKTVSGHTTTINNHATTLIKHGDKITKNTNDVTNLTKTVGGHTTTINNHTTTLIKHGDKIAKNTNDVTNLTKTVGDNTTIIKNNTTKIDDNTTKIEKNSTEITQMKVSSMNGIKRTEQHVNSVENKVSRNTVAINKNTQDINNLRLDFEQYKKKSAVAFAGMAAMNNIPFVDGKQLSLGAGVGYYDGESAVSFGGIYHLEENIVIKASLAGNPNEWQPIIGAGIAVGF